MKEKLFAILENSKSYTLAVAEAMPENDYGTRLLPESWTFSDLLFHIGYGIRWWEANYMKGTKTDWNPPQTPGSKAEIVDYIRESYGMVRQTLENNSISDDLLYGFSATTDHITHHRAQAVLFLRYKNIAPPEYIF